MKGLRALGAALLASWICAYGLHAAQSDAELCARWLESIELDSPAEVLREAAPRVAQAGDLHRNGAALALYARALAMTGDSARAVEFLNRAQPEERTRAPVQLALARIELEQDQLAELVERLTAPGAASDQAARVRFPEHADAWWLLGKARSRLGDSAAAEAVLQHFVKTWPLHPEAPAAWYLLAQAAIARRDLDKVGEYREQAQTLSIWHGEYKALRLRARAKPTDPLPHYGIAQLWSSVNQLERAAQETDLALRLAPDFGPGWALRAELLRKQGNPKQALAAYTKALKLAPKQTSARYQRALLAMHLSFDEVARQDLLMIVDGTESTAPRYLGAHLTLARLLVRMTEELEAQKRYARYRQLGGTEPL